MDDAHDRDWKEPYFREKDPLASEFAARKLAGVYGQIKRQTRNGRPSAATTPDVKQELEALGEDAWYDSLVKAIQNDTKACTDAHEWLRVAIINQYTHPEHPARLLAYTTMQDSVGLQCYVRVQWQLERKQVHLAEAELAKGVNIWFPTGVSAKLAWDPDDVNEEGKTSKSPRGRQKRKREESTVEVSKSRESSVDVPLGIRQPAPTRRDPLGLELSGAAGGNETALGTSPSQARKRKRVRKQDVGENEHTAAPISRPGRGNKKSRLLLSSAVLDTSSRSPHGPSSGLSVVLTNGTAQSAPTSLEHRTMESSKDLRMIDSALITMGQPGADFPHTAGGDKVVLAASPSSTAGRKRPRRQDKGDDEYTDPVTSAGGAGQPLKRRRGRPPKKPSAALVPSSKVIAVGLPSGSSSSATNATTLAASHLLTPDSTPERSGAAGQAPPAKRRKTDGRAKDVVFPVVVDASEQPNSETAVAPPTPESTPSPPQSPQLRGRRCLTPIARYVPLGWNGKAVESGVNKAISDGNNDRALLHAFTEHEEHEEGQASDVVLASADQTTAPPLLGKEKPGLPCAPPVWAQSRQELCESLSYYRSYQGGTYFCKRQAKGYLLDGFGSPRDIWADDGRVIISHGGGKSKADSKGKAQLADSQKSTDARIAALLNTMHSKQPIVLIAGSKYDLFPYDIRCGYVILGYYWITHAWVEREEVITDGLPTGAYNNRYKLRFQYIENEMQPAPWWLGTSSNPDGWRPIDVEPARRGKAVNVRKEPIRSNAEVTVKVSDPVQTPDVQDTKAVTKTTRRIPSRSQKITPTKEDAAAEAPSTRIAETNVAHHDNCRHCGIESPSIYNIGRFCLNPACKAYWKLFKESRTPRAIETTELEYLASFIRRLPTSQTWALADVRPPHPVSESRMLQGHGTAREFWKGSHCKKCGRLSRRVKFIQWECANCGDAIRPATILYTAAELRGPSSRMKAETQLNKQHVTELPPSRRSKDGMGYRVFSYEIPKARSRIYIIRADHTGEVDDLFVRFQKDVQDRDLFRRYPLNNHLTRGTMLTQHFAFNAGEHYKYSGQIQTVSFEEAPQSTRDAREVLSMQAGLVLGSDPQFNEVLSVAYMDDQRMNYHDDGEPGLGPIVCSLSMGSPAVMSFRPKTRKTPRSTYRKADARRAKDSKNKGKACLILHLLHGDLLVMEGRELHDLYEHMVVPTGFRIACTARQINSELH